jgi:hypothetical protein
LHNDTASNSHAPNLIFLGGNWCNFLVQITGQKIAQLQSLVPVLGAKYLITSIGMQNKGKSWLRE